MTLRRVALALMIVVGPPACVSNLLGFEEGILIDGGPNGIGNPGNDSGGGPGSGTGPRGGTRPTPTSSAGTSPCTHDPASGQQDTGCDLRPPSYINVDVCAQIVDDGTNKFLSQCIDCCQKANYRQQSFINNLQCTCATLPDVGDTVTCADQVASNSVCSSCCTNAGYPRSTWNSSLCTCVGQLDNPNICANTLSMPIPKVACPNCCINNGYMGVQFFQLGQQCTCLG
jgi:hypothetical protein